FFPQEGKYHWDGHRQCGARLSPEESGRINNRCPSCGRKLTLGVMNRVERLSDRAEGFVPKNAPGYRNLVVLREIIAGAMGIGKESMGVEREYNLLIQRLGNEFNILLFIPNEELLKKCPPKIAKGILNVREGKVNVLPGYDGVYGKIEIFSGEDKNEKKQLTFF
ncbi:MAG: DNA helicase UvrD, partial [Candidatus Omnitrophota bacterium]|nr:DNA helicase UvrD [Candidatus Omnitrophota bacterium]